ncbi:MAG: septation regulator SpoVG [Ruminococcaceae bacterium]|nr:septation regulator SpoVG [Oscillospiraceae bacterium]
MKITDIKIRKITDNEKMKAVCSVTFDDELVVHDIKVIENDGKTFIAMPSKRFKEGSFSDIVHPISQTVRTYLEKEILAVYSEQIL